MVKVDQEKEAKKAAAIPKKQTAMAITSVELLDKAGVPTDTCLTGDPMTIRINYEARERIEKLAISVNFDYAAEDVLATSCDTRRDGVTLPPIAPGKGHVDLKMGPLLMEPNVYDVNVQVVDDTTDTVLDSVQRQRFILNEQVIIYGLFGLPHKWEVAPTAAGERETTPQPRTAIHEPAA